MNKSVCMLVAIIVWGILTVGNVPMPMSPVLFALLAGVVAGAIVR